MALKNIIITGSIGSIPTSSYGQKFYISSTDEQSFPIEQIIGSSGGSVPNLLGQTSSLNLFINIDQKWSGINDTQAGLVPFIHSTQEEFINGEFSGSNLIVADQRLIDEDCIEFLTVNTTPINYIPYFFSSSFTPLGSFLNATFSPPSANIYLWILEGATNNVKYLKVNRFDNEGVDNTLSLQGLKTIRLKFSDLGIVEFVVSSISEYPTYYLFFINPKTLQGNALTSSDQGNNVLTILNPYLLSNFEYNDCNALFGNVFDFDLNNTFMNVEYETGLNPSNQEQIINNTAERSSVKPYNYSLNAQVRSRYSGVKVTQQKPNVWTPGDLSPSKTPSVQILKTAVAYCDWIGGWPPERMESSGAHIKFLINEDGTTIFPNTSLHTLSTNQNIFISGERVSISSGNDSSTLSLFRNIIRGGTRIEPILYNQSGSYANPPLKFVSNIQFTDDAGIVANPNPALIIRDYTATLHPISPWETVNAYPAPLVINMNFVPFIGADITTEISDDPSHYTITQNILNENVNLIFNVTIGFTNNSTPCTASVYVGSSTPIFPQFEDFGGSVNVPAGVNTYVFVTFAKTIPSASLSVGQKFNLLVSSSVNTSTLNYFRHNSSWVITTFPAPTPPILTSNLFFTSSLYPNFIFSTSSLLVAYYDNPSVRQKDISKSGFSKIAFPFSFKTGDEFRFEGDENKIHTVYSTHTSSAPNLLFNSASINIKLSPQHSSSSIQILGSGTNINQFLVRRYVDDASTILIEGFPPPNSSPPYIVKPEFITPELNKNLSKYIEDLTQKGLTM